MYLYTLTRGEEPDTCEVHFVSSRQLNWHMIVRQAINEVMTRHGEEADIYDIETDDIVDQIEKNLDVKSVCRPVVRYYCNIDLLHLSGEE